MVIQKGSDAKYTIDEIDKFINNYDRNIVSCIFDLKKSDNKYYDVMRDLYNICKKLNDTYKLKINIIELAHYISCCINYDAYKVGWGVISYNLLEMRRGRTDGKNESSRIWYLDKYKTTLKKVVKHILEQFKKSKSDTDIGSVIGSIIK